MVVDDVLREWALISAPCDLPGEIIIHQIEFQNTRLRQPGFQRQDLKLLSFPVDGVDTVNQGVKVP